MRLILHFGLHRSASSALQRFLTTNHRMLRRHRVLSVTQRATSTRDELAVFKRLKGHHVRKVGVAVATTEIENHLDAIAADFDTVIFSEENMPGLMVGGNARAFACAAEFAALLAHLGGRHDIHAIAVVRRHADYLASIHRFRAGRGEPRDFPAFIAGIDLDSVNFGGLLDTVSGAVGRERLDVFSYDGVLRDGGEGLLRRIVELADVPVPAELRLPSENVSPDARFMALMQTLHRNAIVLPRQTTLALGERLRSLPPQPGDAGEVTTAIAGAASRVIAPVTSDRAFKLTRQLLDAGLPLPGISARTAAALVAEAFAGAERQRLAGDALAALKRQLTQRFSRDHAAVAARYLPDWQAAAADDPGPQDR